MKSLILVALLSASTSAFADHYDNKEVLACRVTRMLDHTYLEESLSVEEYPDIDVAQAADGEFTASFGGNAPYEKSEGDSVDMVYKKMEGILVTIKNSYGDVITLKTEQRRTLARGTIRVLENGAKKAKTIGYVICDKGLL